MEELSEIIEEVVVGIAKAFLDQAPVFLMPCSTKFTHCQWSGADAISSNYIQGANSIDSEFLPGPSSEIIAAGFFV